jgi:hypothetical protein
LEQSDRGAKGFGSSGVWVKPKNGIWESIGMKMLYQIKCYTIIFLKYNGT